jgi:two-component system, NtrC family, sensor kinase
MRWGLRVQLLVLLAVLLILSYLPLAFAVATYTRVGMEQLQQENALKLGRSVATHLAGLRGQTEAEPFLDLARLQIAQRSVHAITLYELNGSPSISLGDPELLRPLQQLSVGPTEPEVRRLNTSLGPALLLIEPSPRGYVGATVRVDGEVTGATELTGLLILYLGVSALALIAALYFALTRLIVRPILDLEAAADRVAAGGRRLALPVRAPREVMHLAHRLAQMTDRLLDEEEQLRSKVVEVEAKTLELKEAQGSLVRSERLATVGRLAAGLAHEVGNPISALMGLQDLMLSGELSPDEEHDFLLRMRKETARIDRVMADLLAYARPTTERQSGALPMAGSLRETVFDVLALLEPQKNFQEMLIVTDLYSGQDQVTLGPQQLTQVLMNLMMNAADACEYRGQIKIRTSAQSSGLGPRLVLSVEDDGPGIDPEVKDQIFEPFVTTKAVGQGTGLGLSVSKGLVEAAGGTICAEAVSGGGARFVLNLPRID